MEDQLGNLLAQAQKLQAAIIKIQEQLKTKTVEVSVDDGSVKVVAFGDQSIKAVLVDPNLLHPANRNTLETLIVEGVNGALIKAKEMAEKEMKNATGGLAMPRIPGLF